jgi:phosphoglycolate phosphatase
VARPLSYELAVFDFDGTLADSFPFFVSVFNQLAARHGFRAVEGGEVEALRGLNAREVMRKLGLPARRLPRVARDFISVMRANRDRIAPFPGARELLVDLARADVHVGIVSSNAYDNVAAILGARATAAVRFFACGMSIFGKRAHLRKVPTDVEAARVEGIAFGAVAWGYGDLAQMQALGAELAGIRRLFGVG